MSSSSYYSKSNSNPQKAEALHDVFLSFRGEDTRPGFTSYLYQALDKQGIKTFIDRDKLERGKAIRPGLMKAIHDSRSSVVVLSENYAFSSWCLTELTEIVKCMDTMELIVLPIFYHVDPSHVRDLGGSYGEAFKKHQKNCKLDSEEVETWKAALKRVGNLAGWHLHETQTEAAFVEGFVAEVPRILNTVKRTTEAGFINKFIAAISSILNIIPKISHFIEPATRSSSRNVVDDFNRISLENTMLEGDSSIQQSDEGNLSNEDSFNFLETCVHNLTIRGGFDRHNIWNEELLEVLQGHFQDPGPTKSCSIVAKRMSLLLLRRHQRLYWEPSSISSVEVNCSARNLIGFALSLNFRAKLPLTIHCDIKCNNIKLGSYFMKCRKNTIGESGDNIWLLYLPLCCVLSEQELHSSGRDFEISFRAEPPQDFSYEEHGVRLVFNRNNEIELSDDIPYTAG
ncbi:hypothetical protein FNV43_RR10049 [Rhamnella rubrinervis]|uniref:TIR domain-containing protein n=1 Tax=Rhamnella rubrinervis TaxID=2594499 RepID=A0A8K0HBJ0_9ROSA|nr:hypothetical protein FNV43_RR10049 [Rhamnella rubrinervis]